MSEVHRYKVVTMLSEAGNCIGYDPHGPLVVMASEFDRVTAERDALQERLNAADQRADDLETQLASTEQSRRAWFDSSQAADKRIEQLEAELGPTFDEVRAKNRAVADSLEPGTGRCTFDVLWKSGGSAVDATITEEQYSEILTILNRDVAILSTAFRGAVSK